MVSFLLISLGWRAVQAISFLIELADDGGRAASAIAVSWALRAFTNRTARGAGRFASADIVTAPVGRKRGQSAALLMRQSGTQRLRVRWIGTSLASKFSEVLRPAIGENRPA